MTPASPFMLEILRRIDQAARHAPTPGWSVRNQYPEQQLKGLHQRGLIQFRTDKETVSWSKRVFETEMVGLTFAGLAAIEEPVTELDDLPVLGTVTAAWPLAGR